MLDKARKRVKDLGLTNVEAIQVMDAENLAVADAAFDVVVAQYVVTAIPNPEKALDEFVRVVRPGGEIILTTRIGAETGLRGTIEKWLMPFTTRLGFRTEFPWARYERWAEASKAVRLLERRALPPLGHFWLLRYVRVAD
jgi:phosphatidylethanolamine/phosphatidyl-N-methylethanolamine N-methyltransferase